MHGCLDVREVSHSIASPWRGLDVRTHARARAAVCNCLSGNLGENVKRRRFLFARRLVQARLA